MATCLIGLGSNLGDREQQLTRALELLGDLPQVDLQRTSHFRATRPAGGPQGQGSFLNAAAVLETSLSPPALLLALQSIEHDLGRVRTIRWGERVVDLDLLLYDRLELSTPTLELPHPRMSFRRFVLEPAAEIAPEMVYPINGWTIAQLLANLNRPEKYIAIPGANDDVLQPLTRTGLAQGLRAPDFLAILRREMATEFGEATPPDHSQASLNASFIQLARERAAMLARISGSNAQEWTVSDFWFDDIELLMEHGARHHQLDMSACRAAVQSIRRSVVQPKLVVLYFPNDLQDFSYIQEAKKTLAALSRGSEVGPVLTLSYVGPEGCREEVLAAMQAME